MAKAAAKGDTSKKGFEREIFSSFLGAADPELQNLMAHFAKCTPKDSTARKRTAERIGGIVKGGLEEVFDELPWPVSIVLDKFTDMYDWYMMALKTDGGATATPAVTGVLHDSIEELRKKIIDQFNAESLKTVDDIPDMDLAWPVIETMLAQLKLRMELVDKLKGAHDAHFAATGITSPETEHDWSKITEQCKSAAEQVGKALAKFCDWIDTQIGKLADGPMKDLAEASASWKGAKEGSKGYFNVVRDIGGMGFVIRAAAEGIMGMLHISLDTIANFKAERRVREAERFEKFKTSSTTRGRRP